VTFRKWAVVAAVAALFIPAVARAREIPVYPGPGVVRCGVVMLKPHGDKGKGIRMRRHIYEAEKRCWCRSGSPAIAGTRLGLVAVRTGDSNQEAILQQQCQEVQCHWSRGGKAPG